MVKGRSVYAGALLLQAFMRGEDTPEGMAGAMFIAAGLLALIPDSKRT